MIDSGAALGARVPGTLGCMSVTVDLPDDIAERAAEVAKARGVSVATVITELVSVHLPDMEHRPRRRGFVGLGRSTSGWTSDHVDDMLADGFGRD